MNSFFKIALNLVLILAFHGVDRAQNLTLSPYSRYGLGEINQSGFSQIAGMGGTYIALKPDTSAPLYINAANPAAISWVRLTTLDLGGQAQFTEYDNGLNKNKSKTTNFSYAALAFPVGQRFGACLGIQPYSNVGYTLNSAQQAPGAGEVNYYYVGGGGLNKVYFGLGINPFKKQVLRFYNSAKRDSMDKKGQTKKFKRAKFFRSVLADLSIGGRADYLFGNIEEATSVVYPSSIYFNNVRRVRTTSIGDVTGSFGMQTAFSIDSFGKRELRKKIKIGIGYFVSLPGVLDAKYSSLVYNYGLDGFGGEVTKDTVLYTGELSSTIKLPLEQGVGMSFKKGEMLTISIDAAYTNWQQFRFLDKVNDMKDSYRASLGINYVPDKYAAGTNAYIKRVQYRIGASYSNGFLELKNSRIDNYAITVGLGLPVGLFRQFSMVNISAQFGQMGTTSNNLIREKYARVILGFTFNDKWFNKFRYD